MNTYTVEVKTWFEIDAEDMRTAEEVAEGMVHMDAYDHEIINSERVE